MGTTSVLKSKARKSAVATTPTSTNEIKTVKNKIAVNSAERHQLIAMSAYLKAESRGFVGEDSLNDWLSAEAEIDNQYSIAP